MAITLAEPTPLASALPHPDGTDPRSNGGPINSTGAGADPSSNVTLRALVSSREAGVIIGKEGKAVAELRLATGTKAGVSQAIRGVPDRILSVSGACAGVSKAYYHIAVAILENPIPGTDHSQLSPSPASGPTTIRLLISHNLMGSIIGKQGAKIKEIQKLSGVRMIANKDMLPQSTERIVEVQGKPEAIQCAVQEIGKCLMEDWERALGTILYQPTAPAHDELAPPYTTGGLAGDVGYNRRPSNGNSAYRRPDPAAPYLNGDSGRLRNPSINSPGFTVENLRTQNISIPSDMVGCIIGKAGSKINEIRRLSGSRISIAKLPHDETGERMFTISGTPDANEKALYLLYNQLESEKERRVSSVEEE